MLELKDLTTGYGSHTLLRNATATLDAGELVTLIGANGAGKSTLLKVLCGDLKPLEGIVTINGHRIDRLSRMERARLISVVNTDRISVEALSVREVVEMGRYPHTGFFGRLDANDNSKVEDAMAAVGISHMSTRNVATLSDGERQKMMIARALAQDTPIVLLDEPTAFLDVASRVEVLTLLQHLAKERAKGILLSSHDVASALDLSDRLWLMPGNGALHTGTPAQFIKDQADQRPGNALDSLFANRDVVFDNRRLDYVGKKNEVVSRKF